MTNLKLASIDVGFDLRLHPEHAVVVPADVESAEIDTANGVQEITGSRDEIITALKDAGYTVKE